MTLAPETRRSRSPFGRPKDDGPRAKFSQLLPYLAEHKRILAVVITLSIIAAAGTLFEPLPSSLATPTRLP